MADEAMKQTGLMKHVRAHLAKDPTLTTEQLIAVISPLFPQANPRWLRNTVNHYRWKLNRMARIKAEIFNNSTEPTDR